MLRITKEAMMKRMFVVLSMVTAFAVGAVGALGLGGSVAEAQQDAPRLTMDDARRIALQLVPGGTIESIELDRERGRWIYEVEVRDTQGREHEIEIDANDGSVIRTEIDD